MCKIEDKQTAKPQYELQDIFNKYSDEYIKNNKITPEQNKAIKDISNCRTSTIGYNAKQCNGCGDITFTYNSCRNRNCPNCQGIKDIFHEITQSYGNEFYILENNNYTKLYKLTLKWHDILA